MPPPTRGAPHPPPFFIREIYKNGFLKRLPYNEKKSSALAKLMKTDRFWVVFSIHDDIHPFLELWHEPTEVAHRPPVHIFPLAACQHISTSIVPAGDSEWSFVINFDMAVAIRFSCNSREVMVDWVEVIRTKLGEMGILNPRGNLYSRTPLGPPVTKPVIRDPTSPLPQPPPLMTTAQAASQTATTTVSSCETTAVSGAPASATTTVDKMSEEEAIIIADDAGGHHNSTAAAGQEQTRNNSSNNRHHHQQATAAPAITCTTTTTTRTKAVIETHPSSSSSSFTTSIYLNRKTSLPTTSAAAPAKSKVAKSLSSMLLDVKVAGGGETGGGGKSEVGGGATSSVYLNQSSPTRHVTVIPVNSGDTPKEDEEEERKKGVKTASAAAAPLAVESVTSPTQSPDVVENHTYGEIFPHGENKQSSAVGGDKSRRFSGGGGVGGGSRTDLKSSPVRRQQHPQQQVNGSAKAATPLETSPTRRGRDRTHRSPPSHQTVTTPASEVPPPLPERPAGLMRRLSDRKHDSAAAATVESRPSYHNGISNNNNSSNSSLHNSSTNNNHSKGNNHKLRRKARRSSSLGPFHAAERNMGPYAVHQQSPQHLVGGLPNDLVGASTLSLESVDSNPRQAVPRAEVRRHGYSGLGAIPRRPLLLQAAFSPRSADPTSTSVTAGHHEPLAASNSLSSPSRPANDGVRPPPPPFYHHPIVGGPPPPPVAAGGFPPMVPLPGLTCQLSMPPG
jgi:hypothetical protein